MFLYTRSFLVVFCSSSDTKDVGVSKSDFQGISNVIELFSWWQIYVYNLTELGGKR